MLLIHRLVGFSLLLHNCLCELDRNTSEGSIADMTCDATTIDCQQTTKEVETRKWKPFQYKTKDKWASLKTVYPLYVRWHNDTVYDAAIPCQEKRSIVFSPNAGLGDSIGALTTAFLCAIRTGRLLFIDWKPHEWTVGLEALTFPYNYPVVEHLHDAVTNKPLLCVDQSNDKAAFLRGHLTNQHALIDEPTINDMQFGYDKLSDILLQPSPKVKQIIDDVSGSRLLPSDDTDDGFIVRLVAIVMRTGEGEYNQFLSKGDEMNFVKCFRNYATSYVMKTSQKIKFRVFVTSDNEAVKQNVVKELENGDNGDVNIDVVTLNDSIIHVMHVKEANNEKKSVKNKIRKTYAEYFLIGRCQVLFLTHGSLFGRAAADRGVASESDINFLSDSKCDGKREKYSYLTCHEPKYPEICGIS